MKMEYNKALEPGKQITKGQICLVFELENLQGYTVWNRSVIVGRTIDQQVIGANCFLMYATQKWDLKIVGQA